MVNARRTRARRAAGVTPPPAAVPADRDQVLALPARYLGGLPVATRFVLQGLGIAEPIVWSSAPVAAGARLTFTADDVHAIALGVEAERVWPAHFKAFCLGKLRDATSFQVTPELALAGAQPAAGAPWSLGRVLRWLELELIGIEMDAEPGAPLAQQPDSRAA